MDLYTSEVIMEYPATCEICGNNPPSVRAILADESRAEWYICSSCAENIPAWRIRGPIPSE